MLLIYRLCCSLHRRAANPPLRWGNRHFRNGRAPIVPLRWVLYCRLRSCLPRNDRTIYEKRVFGSTVQTRNSMTFEDRDWLLVELRLFESQLPEAIRAHSECVSRSWFFGIDTCSEENMVFSSCCWEYFLAEGLRQGEVFSPDVKVVFLHLNSII